MKPNKTFQRNEWLKHYLLGKLKQKGASIAKSQLIAEFCLANSCTQRVASETIKIFLDAELIKSDVKGNIMIKYLE